MIALLTALVVLVLGNDKNTPEFKDINLDYIKTK